MKVSFVNNEHWYLKLRRMKWMLKNLNDTMYEFLCTSRKSQIYGYPHFTSKQNVLHFAYTPALINEEV